jgi:phage host-nuclease inhibitor protein Gam
MLQNEVTRLSTDFGCFVGEVSSLSSAAARILPLLEEVSVLKTSIEEELNDLVIEHL